MIVIRELAKYKNGKLARDKARFFKTNKGEYAAGDKFVGITVPRLRLISKKFKNLSLADILMLLKSKYNEYRTIALIFLIDLYARYNNKKYITFYLKNLKFVNNWNLVDISASKLLGHYLYENNLSTKILYKLAKSKNIWYRRIAIVSTYYFIRRNMFYDTLKLAKLYFDDGHHLIHKATGWMLREIGKKNKKVLINFLNMYHYQMPKIMLYYASEHLSSNEKRNILSR